jgi:CheY-like chemotaxis protein
LLASPTAMEIRHRVLLVDDDAVSLELMALLLAHEGHQVVRAGDANAALELLDADQATRPDVLLVDLQMPGISGGQLAEKVRALQGPNPLLLAMSATEARRQQLRAFDGFLLKPFAVNDFRKALQPKKPGRAGTRVAHPVVADLAANQPPVDMAVIEKLLAMMPTQALHDVVAACIADTRACAHALKKQVQEGVHTGVRESAHRIKGAAAMIGATRLTRLAACLESGSGKEAATPRVLDDLMNACSELERMLLAGKLKKT